MCKMYREETIEAKNVKKKEHGIVKIKWGRENTEQFWWK